MSAQPIFYQTMLDQNSNRLLADLNSVDKPKSSSFVVEIFGLTIPVPEKPKSITIEEGRIVIE